ncbi:hypothetical protein UPYG_G00133320 [Umbra pygmaea]|uniref:G-protein coupled receptors family 1 profile domain-containing protein n=1 Tax=Umbra pygmaea TaxID=75934 RepID=A0ABD0WTM0_UMBPY
MSNIIQCGHSRIHINTLKVEEEESCISPFNSTSPITMEPTVLNISANITSNRSFYEDIMYVTTWTTFAIGLPLILIAIYAMYFLIRADHMAPVYVINLLLADLIQICIRPIVLLETWGLVGPLIEFFGISASVGFMVSIALERYLVIAFPLWYRFRRNIKYSLIQSSCIWAFPFIQIMLFYVTPSIEASLILYSSMLLVPFPMLIFFLVGTLKALSVSISVPAVEQRRIIGTLALVLGNYTLLFLPLIIQYLISGVTGQLDTNIGSILESFSPLVDPLLYVFMRKGAKDTLLAFPCFDKLIGDLEHSQVTNMTDTGADGSG